MALTLTHVSRLYQVGDSQVVALNDVSLHIDDGEFVAIVGPSGARSVLVPAGIEAPPLRDYFPKLMDYAQAVRWGKQKMTREAARARRAELAAT